MTEQDIEKVYKELKENMIKLSKKELTEMYNVLYSTPIKSYKGKEAIVWGIVRHFDIKARTKMLKL
ncbi:MAG: hypothetical protein ACRDD7_06830 [Peptostreptococcaceae bacterium]